MDQNKRFAVAMGIYAGLALLVWLTMDGSAVPVGSGQVSLRGLTFALLAFFAVRTLLHWKAERIRAEKEPHVTGTEQ
ncbi:MAG TPA: hypothetical protein VKH81_01300 [Candidatus Angelobacter sp.]|nr:hypothetical protein [Candidatus Angelobacter sp.]